MTETYTCAGCEGEIFGEHLIRGGIRYCDSECYGWMLGRQEAEDLVTNLRARLASTERLAASYSQIAIETAMAADEREAECIDLRERITAMETHPLMMIDAETGKITPVGDLVDRADVRDALMALRADVQYKWTETTGDILTLIDATLTKLGLSAEETAEEIPRCKCPGHDRSIDDCPSCFENYAEGHEARRLKEETK